MSVILDNSSERVDFVALSNIEDDNKENRIQPVEGMEPVKWCTHNALSTCKPANLM
jgi:hypothetical protein